MKPKYLNALFLLVLAMLQACGAAHIQPSKVSDNLDQYTTAYVSSISIQSREQNGNSLEMNKKMEEYAQRKLSELILRNQYRELEGPIDEPSLEFNLDLNIVYGSRAARYWAGFGAGKGSVNSTFEVIDSKTKETKYSSSGASDLAIGVFGGSMEAVIKQNIDELINSYPTVTK